MNWINPPQTVKRYSLQQILQHVAALLLALLLILSALAPGFWRGIHGTIGLASTVLFLAHLFSLLVIGVRHDVAIDHIAFLPTGTRETTPEARAAAGKFTLPEKQDYCLILCWSFLAITSGIVLHWPGRFGVPGPTEYAWLRITHTAMGAGWALHIIGCHVPFRFIHARAGFRWSIFTGKVPLESAESRGGWVASLVETGILVPVPTVQHGAAERETVQVREMLDEGNRRTREGRYEEAASIFEEALRLYPEYSQARFNLAVSRIRQGRPDLASEQLRVFLESDPFNPMAGKARELLDGISRPDEGGTP
ncbi:MAG TPA: tetratricopeptide repeat protein [Candidatus Deferrimicrobiaceae bacterium]|jgi:hypothetical protein